MADIYPTIRELKRKTRPFNAFRKYAWDHHYQAVLGTAWHPTVADGLTLLLQATREGEGIVGAIVGSLWGGITGLEELVVRPEYHTHGVGRALLDAAATWTLEHQGRALSLATGLDWPAYSFYRHLGFEEIGHADHFYFDQPFVWLVKRLTPLTLNAY